MRTSRPDISIAGPVCDPLDQYECKEGVCITMEKVCDGVVDCLFEDDEFDCTDGEDVETRHYKK